VWALGNADAAAKQQPHELPRPPTSSSTHRR